MQSQRVEIGQAIGQAAALANAGRFVQAEALCRAILQARPAEPTALQVLGICLLQTGRPAEAETVLSAALRAQPGQAGILTNLGIALQAQRRFTEALARYDEALALEANQPATLNMRGQALIELQRHEEALASLERAVELAPQMAEAWCSRANALIRLHEYERALQSLDRAQALRPDYGEALSNRSIVLNLLRRHQEALEAAQQAAALLPDRAVVHRNLGDALAGLDRSADALQCYDRAIELGPDDGDAYRARARTRQRLERYEAAAGDYERARALLGEAFDLLVEQAHCLIEIDRAAQALELSERALALAPDAESALRAKVAALAKLKRWEQALRLYEQMSARAPGDPEPLLGRAAVLNELDRFEEALPLFDAALALRPQHAQGLNDRALALSALGRYDEALESFARAQRADPSLHGARWNEALLRLLLGDFAGGWPLYESRWKKSEFIRASQPFRKPQWTGREDLSGKTILLVAEQGLGDVIQFARYAPLIAKMGATVMVGAHRPLLPLLQSLAGVDRLLSGGDAIPPYDFQSPLMSLPLALGTTLETIPGCVPYLHADPARLQRWAERLGAPDRLRVGLAWSGDPRLAHDRRRSIAVEMLAPLLALRAEFHCLSKFVREADREPMQRFGIRHHGDELTDFAETAALMKQMDLVISVDTSIAHLAGALALPLWVLIADPPEYRWMLQREDSPWYPTARLFRQARRGDWPGVIERMQAELDRWIRMN